MGMSEVFHQCQGRETQAQRSNVWTPLRYARNAKGKGKFSPHPVRQVMNKRKSFAPSAKAPARNKRQSLRAERERGPKASVLFCFERQYLARYYIFSLASYPHIF
jgi:hypothetical protein